MLEFIDKLNTSETNCTLGALIMTNVNNLSAHDELDGLKQNLEDKIREDYKQNNRQELKILHPMDVYVSYYKRFGYSYHVLLQLESVILGKAIPRVSSLVEAMFMAELKNMLLTAGHDLDKIEGALTLSASAGTEIYTGMNNKQITAVQNDFMIADSQAVISSILKGPDRRTCIDGETKNVLYTVYAPNGIENELVIHHLNDIEVYVRTFSPDAKVQYIALPSK